MKTFPQKMFFGENVTQKESFRDDDNIEYAYHVGTNIAVFRQTDLDSGNHIQLLKFSRNDFDDFEAKAKKKYTFFYGWVHQVSIITSINGVSK